MTQKLKAALSEDRLQFQAAIQQLTTITVMPDFSSKKSNTLFQLPQAPGMQKKYPYTLKKKKAKIQIEEALTYDPST